MKAKRGILLVSILIGLVTAAGIYRVVNSQQAPPEVTIEYEKVLSAAVTIPANTILTAEMLTVVDMPAEAVHAEAIRDTDMDLVVGAMTAGLIVKDEQILQSRLITNLGEDAGKLSYRIPENMRALSIPINELSAVSGHIAQGDIIDILVMYSSPEFYPGYLPVREPEPEEPVETETAESEEEADESQDGAEEPRQTLAEPEEGEERNPITVYTQFQKVEVLRIGTPARLIEDTSLAATMVLLVTPEQAEELVYAMNTGTITLLLRNPADENTLELEFYNADVFRDERGLE